MKIPVNLSKTHYFFIALIFCFNSLFAQSPVIKYASPQVYFTGKTINPLSPVNTGGAIPANIYKEVTTFAGTGSALSSNGIGTSASFNLPSGIGVDNNSNVYVCDYGSNAIRKITPTGVVTTIGSVPYPTGLTADAAGNVYISSADDNVIYKINTAGIRSVFATGFQNPGGLNFDRSGNLFVADQGSNTIKKVTVNGVTSTIAGTGSAGNNDGNASVATFYRPDGVAVDNSDNIYVADAGNNKIRKITPTGIVSTFAGNGTFGSVDGTGTNARLYYPTGITIDPNDNLYVADYRNNQIRKISPGGEVTTLAGSGSSGRINGVGKDASFNGPIMLTFDALGNLFVTDFNNNLIRKISLMGYTIDKALPGGLIFDAKTGTINGTPTTVSAATNYTITGYNLYGSSTAIVNIQVIKQSTIVFPPIPQKIICDPDFDPMATSGLPITYTSSEPDVADIIDGKIHIYGPGGATITADNGIETATQNLSVSDIQKPYILIAKTATDICEGSEVSFQAQTDHAGANPKFIWLVNGEDVANNNSTYTTSTLKDNDHISLIVVNQDYCVDIPSDPTSDLTVSVTPYSSFTVEISTATSGRTCAGIPVTFSANPLGNSGTTPVIKWFINGQNTGATGDMFTTSKLKDADMVSCQAFGSGKCLLNAIAYSDPITVSIRTDCEINAPNAFTPNGDGVNDYWQVNAVAETDMIKVFNRNGAIIFQSKGYAAPWDGTSNGKPIPVGTYYYLIISKNGAKKVSGNVTILR